MARGGEVDENAPGVVVEPCVLEDVDDAAALRPTVAGLVVRKNSLLLLVELTGVMGRFIVVAG